MSSKTLKLLLHNKVSITMSKEFSWKIENIDWDLYSIPANETIADLILANEMFLEKEFKTYSNNLIEAEKELSQMIKEEMYGVWAVDKIKVVPLESMWQKYQNNSLQQVVSTANA